MIENLDARLLEHNAGPIVPVQLLPYRSPALVEYGNVSKLTEGTGSKPFADSNTRTRV